MINQRMHCDIERQRVEITLLPFVAWSEEVMTNAIAFCTPGMLCNKDPWINNSAKGHAFQEIFLQGVLEASRWMACHLRVWGPLEEQRKHVCHWVQELLILRDPYTAFVCWKERAKKNHGLANLHEKNLVATLHLGVCPAKADNEFYEGTRFRRIKGIRDRIGMRCILQIVCLAFDWPYHLPSATKSSKSLKVHPDPCAKGRWHPSKTHCLLNTFRRSDWLWDSSSCCSSISREMDTARRAAELWMPKEDTSCVIDLNMSKSSGLELLQQEILLGSVIAP